MGTSPMQKKETRDEETEAKLKKKQARAGTTKKLVTGRKKVNTRETSQEVVEGENSEKEDTDFKIVKQETHVSTTVSKKRKIVAKELEPQSNQKTTPKKSRKSEVE